jgi:secreted Zn-dependent insulinase-like peptidase
MVYYKSVIINSDPKIKVDSSFKKDKYYKFSYKEVKQFKLVKCNYNFKLRTPENYIPEKFNIIDKKSEKIEKLEVNGKHIYYQFNNDYNIPKCCVKIWLKGESNGIDDQIFDLLILEIFSKYLRNISYNINYADYNFSFNKYSYPEHIGFTLYGFTDKIINIINDIFKSIHNLKISEDDFIFFKESYKSNIKTILLQTPHKLITYFINLLILKKSNHVKKVISRLDKVTFKDFTKYYENFKNKKIKYYFFGNIEKDKLNDINIENETFEDLLWDINFKPKTYKFSIDD